MTPLVLQFDPEEVTGLIQRYVADDLTRKTNDTHMLSIQDAVRERGFLTLQELLTVAQWKSPRSADLIRGNASEYVEEATRIALTTASEQLRIEILTLLKGVGWPMASVILHWFHAEDYPILDFRALESVGARVDQRYDFGFWQTYTAFCRETTKALGLSRRDLDRALWRHSYESGRRL